ncbi:MAG: right-handed parallel beta-helix repeat-containing protein, partial [Clostridia bacterium]|nr:right-handed parallel beta-helix repeat-containing protein [Clostridia bacterium]
SDAEEEYFNPQNKDRIRRIDLDEILPYVPEPEEFVLFDYEMHCVETRLPNRYSDGTDALFSGATSNDYASLRLTNPVFMRRFEQYDAKAFETMKIYGYIIRGYRKDTFRVSGYDPQSKVISILDWYTSEFGQMRPDWNGVNGDGIEFCVTNVSYELDAAHEYWIDPETNVMYVYDPVGEYRIPLGYGEKKIRGEDYYAGIGLSHIAKEYCCMIDLDRVGYVTFRGLDFENAAGGFIFAYRTAGIVIDDCSFRDSTGHFAVMFEYSLDGEPLAPVIKNSDFDLSLGASVVIHDEASGPDRYVNRTDAVVDNCRVARANLTLDIYGAVVFFDASGGTVSHCIFEDCSRCAVTYQASYDILIEYNDFAGAMRNSEDGGVVYTWGNQDGNCVIKNNLFREVAASTGAGSFSFYCDDGDSGTDMRNNLFFGESRIVLAGAGRDNYVRDNIYIMDSKLDIQSYTASIKEAGEAAHDSWPINLHEARWAKVLEYCETVPGYREALEARRPTFREMSFDYADVGEKFFFLAPANTVSGNVYFNDDGQKDVSFGLDVNDYATIENNRAFALSENPIFVNPTLGDYRIREGADFPDIEFEKIGRY